MNVKEFSALAHESLTQERAPTRRERKQIKAALEQARPASHELATLRAWAFERAGEHGDLPCVVPWLRDIIKLLLPPEQVEEATSRAYFSPGEECLRRIVTLFDGARYSADVCVFTITDDRITRAMIAAHQRGVKLRVISDDEKSMDRGSDILTLERAGVPVAMDDAAEHMHHKFAVFDERVVLTGSYNWTRSAASRNQENLVVSDDPDLVDSFGDEFERLWETFSR